jgi:malonate-semialdehyde dehydrogenase (acetylating)/methylmalonate-semialdehyde dehydrogenase
MFFDTIFIFRKTMLSRVFSRRGYKTLPMIIHGQEVQSDTRNFIDVHNPATQELIAKVPICSQDEMQKAVDSSKEAFKTWSQTSIMARQQIMFKYANLIRENTEELAKIITSENGKTLADAAGDVGRGLQCVEHATAAPNLLLGESAHSLKSCIMYKKLYSF